MTSVATATSSISRSLSPPSSNEEENIHSKSKKNEEADIERLRQEYQRLKEMRSGGRYVPPAKLRALEEKLKLTQSPEESQRAQWDSLKKSLNSLINKVNHNNIKGIVQEIFKHNLIRGRGLFCRSILKAQALALPFTPVYAALAAIVNTKLPIVGELLLTRLILQFRKAFKRNNKSLCLSSVTFIAHLCNHQVAHEIIALQILHLLLENPTDDSVELSVAFVKEAGAFLTETSKTAMAGVFDRLREILHDGSIEKRTQYMVEVLFQIRKDEFKDNPIIPKELDLIEDDEQVTHMIGLDDELKAQETLNIFKFDQNYERNEEKYIEIRRDILGDSDDEEESDEEYDSEDESDEEEPSTTSKATEPKPIVIRDMTNLELVNLRKTIYLTIMSSMSSDEVAHKLFKLKVPEGKEIEIVNMIVETCSQEKIYSKTYGSVAQRFCYKSGFWRDLFAESFKQYYETIHRYDTNHIRNIATLFGYILATDALGWEVFEIVYMTEEASTSSSRIFMKILFQEMRQEMGIKKLAERFKEEYIQPFLVHMFPKGKDADDVRFSINYFTAIGLGVLTEDMREYLENMPPPSDDESENEESDYSDESDDERRRRYSESPRTPSEERGSSISPNNHGDRSPSPPIRTRKENYIPSPSPSPSPRRRPQRSPGSDRSNANSLSPIRNRNSGSEKQGENSSRPLSRSPSRSRSISRSPPPPSHGRSKSHIPADSRSVSPENPPDRKKPTKSSSSSSYGRGRRYSNEYSSDGSDEENRRRDRGRDRDRRPIKKERRESSSERYYRRNRSQRSISPQDISSDEERRYRRREGRTDNRSTTKHGSNGRDNKTSTSRDEEENEENYRKRRRHESSTDKREGTLEKPDRRGNEGYAGSIKNEKREYSPPPQRPKTWAEVEKHQSKSQSHYPKSKSQSQLQSEVRTHARNEDDREKINNRKSADDDNNDDDNYKENFREGITQEKEKEKGKSRDVDDNIVASETRTSRPDESKRPDPKRRRARASAMDYL